MSLRPQPGYEIPDETQRVARAAFPKGTLCLRIADAVGALYDDTQFAGLFPLRGQPAEAPARLALATVLQFIEGLSNRRAADAVRGRIDWKYALGLELTDPGFDHTVLSEFRTRLVRGQAAQVLLDTLLERVRELGLLKRRGRQRTDSTHVLAAVRMLNRLERVGETLRATLNVLAVVAPEWVRRVAEPQWFERYGSRVENYGLPRRKPRAKRWRNGSVLTGNACFTPLTRLPTRSGSDTSRPLSLCDASGASNTSRKEKHCAGARSKRCQQQLSS